VTRNVCTPARWFAFAVLLGVALCGAQELPPERIYEQSLRSVLTLRLENKSGDRYVGSAFLAIKEGVAVTAWHVVHDAVKVTARFADGTPFEVHGVIDYDEVKDLALIKVEAKERPLMTLSTATPPVGTRTYVIGSPKGYEFSIGDGLLSQIQKVDGFNQYQVSCPFSPGNSGGPILNTRGEVVGVAAWTRNGAQNVNFATPVSELAQLNPDKPLVRWKELQGRRKTIFSFNDSKRRNSLTTETAQSVTDLKKLFSKSAGKQVTVVVMQDGAQERFTFTVPPDFVK
jgi:S1-C subfamily serine protease